MKKTTEQITWNPKCHECEIIESYKRMIDLKEMSNETQRKTIETQRELIEYYKSEPSQDFAKMNFDDLILKSSN